MTNKYVSPFDFLSKFFDIPRQYDQKKASYNEEAIEKNHATSYLGSHTMWSAPSDKRQKQKQFISFWKNEFAKYSDIVQLFNTPTLEYIEAHRTAEHVSKIAALFVRHLVDNEYYVRSGTNSYLSQLISEALQDEHNRMDKETLALCLKTTQSYLEELKKRPGFSLEGLFIEFNQYVEEEIKSLEAIGFHLPTTTANVFGQVAEVAGYAGGFVVGGLVKTTCTALSAQRTVSQAAVASVCMLTGSPLLSITGAGAVFIAPMLIEQYTGRLCEFSVAYVIAAIMKKLGEGIGWTAGTIAGALGYLVMSALNILFGASTKAPPFGFNLFNMDIIVGDKSFTINQLIRIEVKQEGLVFTIDDRQELVKWDQQFDDLLKNEEFKKLRWEPIPPQAHDTDDDLKDSNFQIDLSRPV